MSNEQLKRYILSKGLHFWQVARQMGISECTFCRWWRMPLDEDKQTRVLDAIDKLVSERESATAK